MNINFQNPNTCPTIDKNIDSFKSDVRNFIEEFFNEYNPALQNTLGSHSMQWCNIVDSKCDEIYSFAENIFENVRTCNSTMRDEVEYTLKNAESEISNLEFKLDIANREIEDLRDRIKELEEENKELQKEISNLENC